MKKDLMKRFVTTAMASVMMYSVLPVSASAKGTDGSTIVVSLGDSYSSGEGIPEFYGQNKKWEEKVYDEDWLAHRST